jgi:hypothetical protein
MSMYLGTTAPDVLSMLEGLPVVHTGKMDIYQTSSAVVRVEPSALTHRILRCAVDSTPLADGRKLVTITGGEQPY